MTLLAVSVLLGSGMPAFADIQFTDTDGHWAKYPVAHLVERKVVSGYTDGTFLPENNISREETAAMIQNYLVRWDELEGKQAEIEQRVASAIVQRRLDVEADYRKRLEEAQRQKDAQSDTPNQESGRQESRQESGQESGWTERPEEPEIVFPVMPDLDQVDIFSDLSKQVWSYSAVRNLRGLGLISGYPGGEFRPQNSITREEFASIVFHYLKNFPKLDLSKRSAFTDVTDANFGQLAIESLAGAGIIAGYGDGNFQPQRTITRAEAASLLAQLDLTLSEQGVDKTLAQNNRIMLDPGHSTGNGHNRGSVIGNEGDNNWTYTQLLKKTLEEAGFQVDLTRTRANADPGLADRGGIAFGYDLFMSLHTNAGKGSGTEIYDDVTKPSTAFATELSHAIGEVLGVPSRNVLYRKFSGEVREGSPFPGTDKSGDNNDYYGVLRSNGAKRGLLVEHVYHDKYPELALFLNKSKEVAEVTTRVIMKYLLNPNA